MMKDKLFFWGRGGSLSLAMGGYVDHVSFWNFYLIEVCMCFIYFASIFLFFFLSFLIDVRECLHRKL